MKRKQHLWATSAFIGLFILILDSKIALKGAQDGIVLCLQIVIPSLFPFFLLSGLIIQTLPGLNIRIFRRIEHIFRIPVGSGSIFAVGLLSGYPVGAQLVTQAYQDGRLSRETARRMLGFCSNAGPAFLFGMLGPMFTSWYIPWVLWGIHILGACVAGWLLKGDIPENYTEQFVESSSVTAALQKAIHNMALVCGWVILFRVVLTFCDRWFLWLIPDPSKTIFYGILELSNGCSQLHLIPTESVRFLIAGLFLSCGGICVMLQTHSVTGMLGMGMYIQGKAIQSAVTAIMCLFLSPFMFPGAYHLLINIGVPMLLTGILSAVHIVKKSCSNSGKVVV